MQEATTNSVLTDLTKHQGHILQQTDNLLKQCKEILASLPPPDFLGAGVQYISLSARQVFWQSIQTGDNSLGWSNLENFGWLIKHQREVNRFAEYCQCVESLITQNAPISVINQECTICDPEVTVGSSFLLSEGVRQLYRWLAYE